MAYRGDFPECNRCTSFQCETCGLDKGILKTKGLVSEANLLIKWNIIEIVVTLISNEKFFKMWHIIFYVVSIVLLLVYRMLREQNSQANPDMLLVGALVMTIAPFLAAFLVH